MYFCGVTDKIERLKILKEHYELELRTNLKFKKPTEWTEGYIDGLKTAVKDLENVLNE